MTANLPRITIVGLGPGDPSLRTVGVQQALADADAIILRTRIHPGLEDLVDDPRVSDCDDLYDGADRFEDLYLAIAERVLDRAAAGKSVVYAVPGHPRFAERAVSHIESLAHRSGVAVDVHDGVSFFDTAVGVVQHDPVAGGLQIVDAGHLAEFVAREPFATGSLGIIPTRPVLIAQLYNHELAVATKLALMRLYPDNHPVTLLRGAGIPSQSALHVLPLFELDRHELDHLTSLWIPPLMDMEDLRTSDAVARIVARLRAPGGCPWDRDQTHSSLRNAVLNEAYEVVDAIDAEDPAGLVEELGDLLLLVAMHSQLAEEAGSFGIEHVYEELSRKLIRRHPHVFASVHAETAEEVISTWEGVKAAERLAKGTTPELENRFNRLPRSMPAMRKAIELLAPRRELRAPPDDHAGDPLLAAISSLIDRGIDPDRALEQALRNDKMEGAGLRLAAATAITESAKGHA